MSLLHLDDEAIFHVARKIEASEARAAYLVEVCGEDRGLRVQVDALLSAYDQERSFLESSPVNPDEPNTAAWPPLFERPGTTIGPYKLLERIGEGGMGSVYVAEQSHPVRRRVALKIIKPGMDTKQVLARFEAERQALAMMDHPNIAKVHDAGSTVEGRPYFVMELVNGIPITDYCDRARLSVPERLDLFVLVCRAVQHAHQKGIIHRDLKPSNILVTLIDGAAVPKVIDFGIAKTTGGQLTDRSIYTGFDQLIGTPLYMSPEQAALSGVDVDTRSDIYSLGILLYELLTGTTPIDRETLSRAAYDEIRRVIREQEPPKPSTRISSLGRANSEVRELAPALDIGDRNRMDSASETVPNSSEPPRSRTPGETTQSSLAAIAGHRKTDPRKLAQTIRGELDWIVMKALEKDRRRRYETANDFAADVMRYLTDQPVDACPPSARYQFTKFAKRNRGILTTTGLVALTLIIGAAVSVWQAIRATTAEHQATESLEMARRAVDDLYDEAASRWLTEIDWVPLPEGFLLKVLPFYERFAAQPRVDTSVGIANRKLGQIQVQLGRDGS